MLLAIRAALGPSQGRGALEADLVACGPRASDGLGSPLEEISSDFPLPSSGLSGVGDCRDHGPGDRGRSVASCLYPPQHYSPT